MQKRSSPEFYDPLHKANLCFYVYLNESDGEGGELLKIRPMKVTYHLDDDTISLFEPHSTNSGHIQVNWLQFALTSQYRVECSQGKKSQDTTNALAKIF
jgi:hypothetical protein